MFRTYDQSKLPTYEEAVKLTFPDYDNFDDLKGVHGASGILAEYTRSITYKVKVDPPVDDCDVEFKTIPAYPKFVELFGKQNPWEITIADVEQMFNKDWYDEKIAKEICSEKMQDAAIKIMEKMQVEGRFDFKAKLTDKDLAIIKELCPDCEETPETYADILQSPLDICEDDFEADIDEDEIVLSEEELAAFAKVEDICSKFSKPASGV